MLTFNNIKTNESDRHRELFEISLLLLFSIEYHIAMNRILCSRVLAIR